MQFGAMNLYAASRKSGHRTLSPSFTLDILTSDNQQGSLPLCTNDYPPCTDELKSMVSKRNIFKLCQRH